MCMTTGQCLVGHRLEPFAVGLRAVDGPLWVVVEQMDHFGEARAGEDQRARACDLGPEVMEVGPRPVVHLGRVEVGAEHLAHADAIPLGTAGVGFRGVGRVGVTEVAGKGGVRSIGRLGTIANRRHQTRREPGVRCCLSRQAVEPAIIGPGCGLVGGGKDLASRGNTAARSPLFVGGAEAFEGVGHGVEPSRYVLPGRYVCSRHQIEDAAKPR